ncbi:lipopolysaccharide biosynthesis protein [Tistrella bauzanensis]|uniref:Lipopolysaccharide biosynthesis protein n=2 Tax=Tistrella arctica TaxID=3133430 RepID=A0ABU9YJ32_9PROT
MAGDRPPPLRTGPGLRTGPRLRTGLPLLLRQGGTLFSGTMVAAVIAFVQSVLLTRLLGLDGFGRWGLVVAAGITAVTLCRFRVSDALAVFVERERARARSYYMLATAIELASRLIAAGGLILLSPLISHSMVQGPALVTPLMIYAASLIADFPESAWFAACRDQDRYRLIAAANPAPLILQLAGLGIISAAGWLSITALAINAVAAATILSALKLTHLSRLLAGGQGAWRIDRNRALAFIRFSAAGWFANVVNAATRSADLLILGALRSDSEVGAYRLARSLMQIVWSFGSALTNITFKDIAGRIAAGTTARLYRELRRASLALGLAALAIYLLTVPLGARPVIIAIFGADAAATASLLAVLLPAPAIAISLFWAQPLLLNLHRLRAYTLANGCLGLGFLMLAIPMTAIAGATGLAIAFTASWSAYSVAIAALAARALARRRAAT